MSREQQICASKVCVFVAIMEMLTFRVLVQWGCNVYNTVRTLWIVLYVIHILYIPEVWLWVVSEHLRVRNCWWEHCQSLCSLWLLQWFGRVLEWVKTSRPLSDPLSQPWSPREYRLLRHAERGWAPPDIAWSSGRIWRVRRLAIRELDGLKVWRLQPSRSRK